MIIYLKRIHELRSSMRDNHLKSIFAFHLLIASSWPSERISSIGRAHSIRATSFSRCSEQAGLSNRWQVCPTTISTIGVIVVSRRAFGRVIAPGALCTLHSTFNIADDASNKNDVIYNRNNNEIPTEQFPQWQRMQNINHSMLVGAWTNKCSMKRHCVHNQTEYNRIDSLGIWIIWAVSNQLTFFIRRKLLLNCILYNPILETHLVCICHHVGDLRKSFR